MVPAAVITMPVSATTEPPVLSDSRPAGSPARSAGKANAEAENPEEGIGDQAQCAVTDQQADAGPGGPREAGLDAQRRPP